MKALTPILFLGATLSLAPAQNANRYESVRQEIRQAIARGNAWLKSQQKPEGNWDETDLPAFTALALNAAVRDPNIDRSKPLPDYIEKGYQWLIAQQKEDGGIYNRGLSTYNTALAVTAIMAGPNEKYEDVIVKARKHLIGNQWDLDKQKEPDNPSDGGVGYGAGTDKPHNDLSNTYLAIEALALSKKVVAEGKHGDQPDLNWDAALKFLSRCQNLKETNDQPWASDDPKNKGGFVYNTVDSKAGKEDTGEGRTALRSYGTMSYAGLLSLIYAKLGPNDPRVATVKEWLAKNYTLEENPGMGSKGLYYYYNVMSKALTAANQDTIKLENGKEVDWRVELGNAILSKQRGDGSWLNSDGGWMESNPVLVTSYQVIALEQVLVSLSTSK